MHNYSFAKDDTIYLNMQFNLKSSRDGAGALFRFSNHKVEVATQFFLIVNYVTGLTTIGYSDPTNQWLCTSHALETGQYRAFGTLKMH